MTGRPFATSGSNVADDAGSDEARALYLDLLKKCLTRLVFEEPYFPIGFHPARHPLRAKLLDTVQALARARGLELVRASSSRRDREEGLDWPMLAETMVGMKRLDNVQRCVTDVLVRGVPGDLIETGVWRGGVTILMRAILRAYGDTRRAVWVADSFRGLPKPSGRYAVDIGSNLWQIEQLAVSQAQVRANFERYGLLDEQVRFLEGFFDETLPDAPFEQLAVARLDGDMYESTIVALEALYPKLSVGGFLIVDDYALDGCRAAVQDYRREHAITEPIEQIDWTGAYWQRRE
jgi:O-methyltransferase